MSNKTRNKKTRQKKRHNPPLRFVLNNSGLPKKKTHTCGYQSLFPRLYRLLITIILQDHPGSSRQTLRCFLIVDPRACGYAQNPSRCVSTPPSEKEKPAKGQQSHNWRRGSEAATVDHDRALTVPSTAARDAALRWALSTACCIDLQGVTHGKKFRSAELLQAVHVFELDASNCENYLGYRKQRKNDLGRKRKLLLKRRTCQQTLWHAQYSR